MAETDVKPCPFCGGKDIALADTGSAFWMRCEDCGCETDARPNGQQAKEAWHRRAALSGTRKAEPVALTDDQIIELAVCHSNYKESADQEVFSHRRLIEFARVLLTAAPRPAEVDPGAQVVTDALIKCQDVLRLALTSKKFSGALYSHANTALHMIAAALASPAPAQQATVDDWKIDQSAGSDILTYKDCSVIQDEEAHWVLGLIRTAQKGPSR